jgi:hypothetical protein
MMSALRCRTLGEHCPRPLVRLAREICGERCPEGCVTGIGRGKQCKTGVELQIVRAAENQVSAPPGDRGDTLCAFHQSSAEDRVPQIRLRLVKRCEAVKLRGRAVTQATQLRKDEPHPMGPFPSGRQLVQHLGIHRLLCSYETLQAKRLPRAS